MKIKKMVFSVAQITCRLRVNIAQKIAEQLRILSHFIVGLCIMSGVDLWIRFNLSLDTGRFRYRSDETIRRRTFVL